MSNCIDPSLGKKLKAYELGLLKDKELEEFELHLLDCLHCNKQALEFKDAATLIRNHEEIRQHVNEIGVDNDTELTKKAKVSSIYKLAIAAVIIAVLIIIRPWNVAFSPSREAVAAQNRITILNFENLEDPGDTEQIGEITTSLLITDLSESQYVLVLSTQQRFDVLKQLGVDEQGKIGKKEIDDIVEKSSADWLITGQILKTEPRIEFAARLTEVATSKSVTVTLSADSDSNAIFKAVDQLTDGIKSRLQLPGDAYQEGDPRITDVTTYSYKAYQYYNNGLKSLYRLDIPKAIENFQQSLAFDSTFAMVYYYLSKLSDPRLIDQAIKYMDKATTKEKLLIKSSKAAMSRDYESAIADLKKLVRRYPDDKEAYYWLGRYNSDIGEFEKSIEYLNKAIKIDPEYKLAYNQLAYAYHGLNDLDKAIETIDAYIKLAPDEANPHDTKGNIYAIWGEFDKAIKAFEDALQIDPDFPYSIQQLAHLYLLKGNLEQADSLYEKAAGLGDARVKIWSHMNRAQVLVRAGKLASALNMIDTIKSRYADVMRKDELTGIELISALVSWKKKDYASAEKYFNSSFELASVTIPSVKYWSRDLYIHFLTESGQIDRAKEILTQMGRELNRDNWVRLQYNYSRGALAFYDGDYESAINYLAEIEKPDKRIHTSILLSRAYLKTGQPDKAIPLLEEIHSKYFQERITFSVQDIEIIYYLGMAYEQRGDIGEAIRHYENYVRIRENADPGIDEVADARNRLKILEAEND